MIEVCIPTFRRAHRIPIILEQLKKQTVQNFRVNIWNDSGKKLDVSGFPMNRVQVIDSNVEHGSRSRFHLVPLTTGNPIIFLDDDESCSDDFVEYYYEQYKNFGNNCILGWHSRIFDKESYWHSRYGLIYGTEVDYCGTHGMVLDRNIFDEEITLQNIPEGLKEVEDLYLCYIARMKYGMKVVALGKSNRRVRVVRDGKDQSANQNEYKERAFKILRGVGWKLLKDKIKLPLVGLTWGAFDILHVGHLNLLRNAKKRCDRLVVCVSDDEYIEKVKGHKPFMKFSDRMNIIKSIKFVDDVDIQTLKFAKKDAVKKYKPSVLFVGDDWTPETYGGEGLGIPVVYLPYTKDISSTKLRNDYERTGIQ